MDDIDLGAFRYKVLTRDPECRNESAVDLQKSPYVTKYSYSQAVKFTKQYGDTSNKPDWLKVLSRTDVLDSLKDDPINKLLGDYLRERLEKTTLPTPISQSELVLLGSVFMTAMFEQGIKGEILHFVMAYFCKFYSNEELRVFIPSISMIVNMCSENSVVPYQILKRISFRKPFKVGYGLLWPLKFNLVIDHDRFSRKYFLPYFDEFLDLKMRDQDDRTYMKFMMALRLFFATQLRFFEVQCNYDEFDFAINDSRIRVNLCMYFGFMLKD